MGLDENLVRANGHTDSDRLDRRGKPRSAVMGGGTETKRNERPRGLAKKAFQEVPGRQCFRQAKDAAAEESHGPPGVVTPGSAETPEWGERRRGCRERKRCRKDVLQRETVEGASGVRKVASLQ